MKLQLIKLQLIKSVKDKEDWLPYLWDNVAG